ncbi:N-acetylmuramoyl-L-alanine amidase [Priestia abyssalis]|uniref:N-acetylmuramoyl-L-alanine amidase n=1 Tax=Priestia abyssalis TaxID=1221450 RepID=UPI0014753862|nr:N-acetylmuramoyl-L-alanine amidase [Priestia abyssalis]
MTVKYLKFPLYFQLGILLFFLAFQPQTNAQSEFVSVQVNVLNVRSGPGTSHDVVDKVTKGSILSVVEKLDDWYHVQLTNGLTGWVAKRYVDSLPDISDSLLAPPSLVSSPASGLQGLYGTSLSTLQHKTIVIDAGHGGRDKGATGTSASTLEKDLNLITAKLLEKRLKALGADVIMTRTIDQYVSLETRVNIAKEKKADVFLSIHYNSSPDTALQGIITYYDHHKALAESIHHELISLTTFTDKQARYGDYYVLRENSQPSVLLELGFLSHEQEEARLQTDEFQYNAVTAIVKGLTKYFSEENK